MHSLLGDLEVLKLLKDRWGQLVTEDGQAVRERIAEIVFNDPTELEWLETILFPLVEKELLDWQKQVSSEAEAKLAVVEVPLLFEAGIEEIFDLTVCVIADDEIRMQRLEDRQQKSLAGREERQLSQSEKASRCDRVIENNGSTGDLNSKVIKLVGELIKEQQSHLA